MNKEIFAQRLKETRLKKKMSLEELASIAGTSKTTLSKYERGLREPKITILNGVAEALDVRVDWLVGYKKDVKNKQTTHILEIFSKLDFFRQEKVCKYTQQQLDEQNMVINLEDYCQLEIQSELTGGTGYLDLDPNYVEEISYDSQIPAHDLAFRINGNSMEPVFKNEDIVFVEKNLDVKDGQIGIVTINDKAFIKKIYEKNNQLRLVSLNKTYEDIIVNENDDIKVVGRVIL